MKVTLDLNDVLMVAGAAVALAGLAAIHWALAPVALGTAVAGFGVWRELREPPGHRPGPD